MKKHLHFLRTTLAIFFSLLFSDTVFGQQIFFGNGSAGAGAVSGTQIINNYYPVTSITGNLVTCSGYTARVGDALLLIQMDGYGTWEWDTVVIGGNPFTVSNLTRSFYPTIYPVQIVTVPQYTSLIIGAGGTLTAQPWNGLTGGVLSFIVRDTFSVIPGGKCDVSGLGYQPDSANRQIMPGGSGGAGGTAGLAGYVGTNGGNNGLVVNSGTGLAGDGGYIGSYGAQGSRSAFSCPGCGSSAFNQSSNTYGPNFELFMGGAGYAGDGGAGGDGGGGGGGGANGTGTGQNGTAGSAGGHGGFGGFGAAGGGLIAFSAHNIKVLPFDTVFISKGNNAGPAGNATAGGPGGDGGMGGDCVAGDGGGGGGAWGGNGGNGGNGGAGGWIMGYTYDSSFTLIYSHYSCQGGQGGSFGLLGLGGAAGLNAPRHPSCSAGSSPGLDSCSLSVVMSELLLLRQNVGYYNCNLGFCYYTSGNVSLNPVYSRQVDSFTTLVYTTIGGITYYTELVDPTHRYNPTTALIDYFSWRAVTYSGSGYVYDSTSGHMDTFSTICIYQQQPPNQGGSGSSGNNGTNGANGSAGANGGAGGAGGGSTGGGYSVRCQPFTANYTNQSIACACGYGFDFNSFESSVSGGYPPYSFQIGPGAASPTGISYTATVMDNIGCVTQFPLNGTYSNNALIIFRIDSILNPHCMDHWGGDRGAVYYHINILGGLSNCNPWSLTISDSSSVVYSDNGTSQTHRAVSLPAGVYSYKVTSGSSCLYQIIDSGTFSLQYSNILPVYESNVDIPTCARHNGSIEISPGAGFPPYTYIWSNGDSTALISSIDSGYYTVTVADSTGICSSVSTFFLPNLPATTYTHVYGSCCALNGPHNYYIYNGWPYPIGTYTIRLTGSNTCDSIIILDVSLHNFPTYTDLYLSICWGGSVAFDGNIYNQAGNYSQTLSTVNGCDSIVTLHLNVNPPINAQFFDTICFGSYAQIGSNIYTLSGTYLDTLTSVGGCDSIVTLNLTVSPPLVTQVYDTVCLGSSIQVGANIYTQTGIYLDTISGVGGCDSIIALNLTVNPPIITQVYDTVCLGSSIQIGSNIYTQTGIYLDTISGVGGCDSVIASHLSFLPIVSVRFDTICSGSFIRVGSNIHTLAGTYIDTLYGIDGCESIITLNLAVNPPIITQVYDTVCLGSSIQIGSNIYTQTGIYLDTISGVGGCDSVIASHLSFLPIVSVRFDTICPGSSLQVGSNIYTQIGTYLDTLSGAGCDTILTSYLSVIPINPLVTTTVSHGPVISGMQTDTFTATSTNCLNPYYSWYQDISPIGIHSQTAIITYPVGSTDSITCRVYCAFSSCASVSFATSNSIHTGLTDLSAIQDVSLYPNPTQGTFNMDINASSISNKDAQISVIDLIGQSILTQPVVLHSGYNSELISIGENVVSGIYIVRLTIDSQSLFYRIVVDK